MCMGLVGITIKSPKLLTEQINWKGIGDYLSAARTLEQHGTANTSGPRIHCQGLALELALKYYLWDKYREYPQEHDLEKILNLNQWQYPNFSAEEITNIKILNTQYAHDGNSKHPARYRPASGRIIMSISVETLEMIIARIISSTSQPELIELILAR